MIRLFLLLVLLQFSVLNEGVLLHILLLDPMECPLYLDICSIMEGRGKTSDAGGKRDLKKVTQIAYKLRFLRA